MSGAADGLRLASTHVDEWYELELLPKAFLQSVHSVLVGFAD
jgi:hypothetical protein